MTSELSLSLVCPSCGNKVILRLQETDDMDRVKAWCCTAHLRPQEMEITRKAVLSGREN